jgi:hypothetical protein
MADFRQLWQQLRDRLSPEMIIDNWSHDKNYTGKKFKIARVNYDEIAVGGEGINGVRSVSRTDFEKLYPYWERYKQGLVPRGEIGRVSKNTTYVFSIFHWSERPAAGE